LLGSAVAPLDLPGLPGKGRMRSAVARAIGAAPPPGLVLGSIVSIQIGAALAVHLFPALGPAGTVFLRVGIAALLLMFAARPALDRNLLAHGWLLLQFGCVMGAMNLCFYEAIARIPLGTAVTIGFIGPLGVAALTSRRALDFFWIGLAVVGLAVLAPRLGQTLDPWGVLLAAIAAAGWARFILLSRRVGQAFPGGSGLALGMVVAATFLMPFGLPGARAALLDPLLLAGALAVAVLSTALPFALEFEALKRLSARTYGVLVTLEPAVAVLVGVVLLAQPVGARTLLAVSCVMAAAIGVTWSDRLRPGG
jgi:inner membrane transporter RhtA